jgi:hypothetical protein
MAENRTAGQILVKISYLELKELKTSKTPFRSLRTDIWERTDLTSTKGFL